MLIFTKFRTFFLSVCFIVVLFEHWKLKRLKKIMAFSKLALKVRLHTFMKFWKHSFFVYFWSFIEFSLDDFLCSLITNESENSFQHCQHIILCGSFFCQILRFLGFFSWSQLGKTLLSKELIYQSRILHIV